jgi:hypothetical protein
MHTIYTGGKYDSHLLVPLVPRDKEGQGDTM